VIFIKKILQLNESKSFKTIFFKLAAKTPNKQGVNHAGAREK
jgi:hypothetical protein